MSDHTDKVKRIVTDIYDPASKVKEQDVELLFHHLRSSFSDEKSLLNALKLDENDHEATLARLKQQKEQLIDHNLDED